MGYEIANQRRLPIVIDPFILLPIAAVAVLLVVLFIRAVSGHRQALVTEKSAREFLKSHEPHLNITSIQVSENEKAAVVLWQETDDIGLIRSFGDKLVLQNFDQADITNKSGTDGQHKIMFPRQGLAHPPAAVDLPAIPDLHSGNVISEGTV